MKPPVVLFITSPASTFRILFHSHIADVFLYSCSTKEAPQGSLDLRYCDISTYDKSGKADLSRFNIDNQEKSYKFKAVTPTEGEKWVKNLNEWKDYFLMNMSKI
jgi:hypothetical protein